MLLYVCIHWTLFPVNGLETYLAIKEFNPKVVAIIMTAYRYECEDLIKQALKNGAYACFYKPFDMDEVLKLVEEISKRKKVEYGR